MSINFDKVNFKEFFGWVKASNTKLMKSSSFRGVRAHYTEKSFCKWSNGQLKHVGLFDNGRDFVIKDTEESVEMKSKLDMFKKNGDCSIFVLKNFNPSSQQRKDWKKEDLVKTFDYILLIDTRKMSVGYSTWEQVYDCIIEGTNDPKVELKNNFTMIAENITPAERECDVDKMFSCIEEYL
jgi:hypothetical protein